MENNIAVLEAKKNSLFKVVRAAYDLTKKNLSDSNNLVNLQARVESLPFVRESFIEALDKFNECKLEKDKAFVPDYSDLDQVITWVGHAKKALLDAENAAKPTGTEVTNVVRTEKSKVRLPALELPSFSGEFSEFNVFYESFKSLIHDNKDLDNTQKVQYLISKLSGKALNICAGIPATADNYQIIFDSLVDKYRCKRSLARAYLSKILSFKQLKGESPDQLNALIDELCASVLALKKVDLTSLSDFIIAHITLSKLDSNTLRMFEMSLKSNEIPTFDKVHSFLKDQVKILTCLEPPNAGSGSSGQKTSPPNKGKVSQSSFMVKHSNSNSVCEFCKMSPSHPIYSCRQFLDKSPEDRYQMVRGKGICINCLNSEHKVKNCQSKYNCKKCNQRHSTLLHFQQFSNSQPSASSPESAPGFPSQPRGNNQTFCALQSFNSTNNSHSTSHSSSIVLLPTAQVYIVDSSGVAQPARVILDSASSCNLITLSCCRKLGLPLGKVFASVKGIGDSDSSVKGQTDFSFTSRFDTTIKYQVNALVVDTITGNLPSTRVPVETLHHLRHLPWADPDFHTPSSVDAIVGAQLFSELFMMTRVVNPSGPVAMETTLGYVMMGSVSSGFISNHSDNHSFHVIEKPLELLVQKFWEIEDVCTPKVLNQEEADCEEIFQSTVSRDTSGRYSIAMPFKHEPSNLGNSYLGAERRFHSLERKLHANPLLHSDYSDIIQSYLDKGIMSPVDNDDHATGYYVPHHVIVKQESLSSRNRIVFDYSFKSDSGKSLNDLLYTGPKLYSDLFDILLNMRFFPIAMSSDISKMYLNINMATSHHQFQKLLWRFRKDEPLRTYCLNTLNFGLNSAPFLALRTVKQLISDEKSNFPLACEVADRDMYMDDIACSVPDIDEACLLQNQLVKLFRAGGFNLTKWSSNSSQVLDHIPEPDKASHLVEWDSDSTHTIKILGLRWNPNSDTFSFQVQLEPKLGTKRHILSTVARIFDPLGLVQPVVLVAKLLIRDLWSLKLGWDSVPTDKISQIWNEFQSDLPLMSEIEFPRHISVFRDAQLVTLIGFSDSSELAYGGVVYCRTVLSDGQVKVHLVCSKSRVAPLKSTSIPRLELCGALLLAQLISRVHETYRVRQNIDKIFCFSDSMVTLHWIRSSPHRWQTFVANRVAKIHELVPQDVWFHVAGLSNPADCLTRPIMPQDFSNHPLWFTGPEWLMSDIADWPLDSFPTELNSVPEEKSTALAVVEQPTHLLLELSEKFSSWLKLLNIIIFMFRFIHFLPQRDFISVSDRKFAEIALIKALQRKSFAKDISALENNKPCSPALRHLNPFLQDGLLRVGGRLSNSLLGYEHKHPVILPKKHPVVNLIIDFHHTSNLHTGPSLLLAILRKKYWILSGRDIVRHRVKKCNHCFRLNPKPTFPLMADLPPFRVQETKSAFTHTGIDYAGPFHITLGRRRGIKSQKAYLCLFICLVTKAVHLELVSDLSTALFMAALKRFVSRRGPVSVIYTDNGTNFIGCKNELDVLYKFLKSSDHSKQFAEALTFHEIEWKFLPPTASHFAGIWEAHIKRAKTHLYKAIGHQILTYEELGTVLTSIESILNSKPLCVLSSDGSEPSALTPAHFLNLVPLQPLPSKDVTEVSDNRLTRYELMNKIVQVYWKRWSLEYLSSLQERQKWTSLSPPLTPGTVVVVMQDLYAPQYWPMGVVTETFPGKDGITRVASVRTAKGIFKRPVVKLCILPTQ
uniref:Integrase catalytic domain-containing protein n=1 Tax=Cacopsylla melanoneura TaxID=428564 RepID=A0A8D9AJE5_9HEMI